MLREMYEGKIAPWERHNRCTAEQLEITQKIAAEEKYFESKLSPEDYERFEALFSMHTEIYELNEYDIYSYGFSVGLLLMQDVMNVIKEALPSDQEAAKPLIE